MVFKDTPEVTYKPKINIGCLFDIPTGAWITGPKGESILVGGIGAFTGLVGINNSFKSTIMNYMGIMATDRMYMSEPNTTLTTYDTEGHMDKDRLNMLSSNVAMYLGDEPTYNYIWSVYGKDSMTADEFEDNTKTFIKDFKKSCKYTVFTNKLTKETLRLPTPKMVIIDSFSMFSPKTTDDAIAKAGEKGKETIYMKDGLYKARFIDNILSMHNKGNIMYIMSAHLGEVIDMSGMFEAGPLKKAQFLKGNTKIKKVPDNFMSMATTLWEANPSLFKDSKGVAPEYPTKFQTELVNNKTVVKELATELQVITLRCLRNKGGKSGFDLKILVSQEEGVLPALSEFHYIKMNKFGITGTDRSYYLDIYPDVTLSRTTVRDKIKEDKKLQRACNILSEMKQMEVHQPSYKLMGYICDPKELYEDIKALGYDWNEILSETRGWWTIDNYNKKYTKFLSTLDLLKIRKGEYTPYWKGK